VKLIMSSTMEAAGIARVFKAHSTRAAASTRLFLRVPFFVPYSHEFGINFYVLVL